MKKKIDNNNESSKANIIKYGKMSVEELKKSFGINNSGYSTKEVLAKLEKYGSNEVETSVKERWYNVLFSAFVNPFSLILIIIAIISFLTEGRVSAEVLVLSVIIVISALVRFEEDMRTKKSAEKLKAMVSSTTTVIRNGKETEISIKNVAIGDIVQLSAGDMMPADLRIISCTDLFVSQSTLTGEAEPAEKHAICSSNEDNNIFELENICYMGTNVVSGSAQAVAIATGKNTYLGQMAESMLEVQTVTAFDKGINKVSALLVKVTLVMVPLVFLINCFTKGDIKESLLFAITVAVGIMPQLLPMIVTSNLAKGAYAMSKKKTVVKNLNSIQNLGAMDILCTDKTGTLTQDHIILERYLDAQGKEDLGILRHAYLNSHFQTGLKNLLDVAIIERANKNGLNNLISKYKKVDEMPFDFNRRRMSVVLEDESGKTQLITKGASEEIISICKYIEIDGKSNIATEELKKEAIETAKSLNAEGLRVIAVAQKRENIRGIGEFNIADESDMVLIGYVAFLDPPKESASEAIAILKEYGVEVKVITGDNDLVARKVCSEVGIPTEFVLVGREVEAMTDEELMEKVERTTIFAKISPLQKARIVSMLQAKDHIVGYMGDGINDAAALRKADVSISVDTAVDIAKSSSDIILLEKNLLVLQQGVAEGRKIFANIMKYLNMATSSNIGNMISVIFASIFIPFLPMLPIQILAQNLLYDFSQASIPFDNVDEEYLKKSKKWDTKGMLKFICWLGPVSSIFDLITFGILWWIVGANTIANQALFQTGWFVMGLASQTIIVHIIRTAKVPFIQSRASNALIVATVLITAIGVILPFTGIGTMLDMVPLPIVYIELLGVIMISYALITQLVKQIYIRIYDTWL